MSRYLNPGRQPERVGGLPDLPPCGWGPRLETALSVLWIAVLRRRSAAGQSTFPSCSACPAPPGIGTVYFAFLVLRPPLQRTPCTLVRESLPLRWGALSFFFPFHHSIQGGKRSSSPWRVSSLRFLGFSISHSPHLAPSSSRCLHGRAGKEEPTAPLLPPLCTRYFPRTCRLSPLPTFLPPSPARLGSIRVVTPGRDSSRLLLRLSVSLSLFSLFLLLDLTLFQTYPTSSHPYTSSIFCEPARITNDFASGPSP